MTIWRDISVAGWIIAVLVSLWVFTYALDLMHRPDTMLLVAGIAIVLVLGLAWVRPVIAFWKWATSKAEELLGKH